MKSEHINPFIQGAQTVFSTVCAERPKLGKPKLKKLPYKQDDVAIRLGIVGGLKGDVVYNMKEETAKALASKMMMGFAVETFDDMAKSAVCELTNMISGSTCTLLSGQGFAADITPPSVLTGQFEFAAASSVKDGIVSIPLQFQSGDVVEMDICVEA
ncbi:MAG: chemotaxis protein CheX [Clostridiales bacterium]|nr:chemotaxis protein CheX [Clostridiales bacterium]